MNEMIKNHKKAVIIVGCICLAILLIYASYVHWTNYVKTKEVVNSLDWKVPLTENYTFRDNYIKEKEKELENINLQIVIEAAKPIGKKEPIFEKVLGAKNKQGETVIPPIYVWLEVDLKQGYILATTFDTYKAHYYNLDGTDYIKKDFLYADEFKNGYACVQKEEEKSAIIDTKGEEILEIDASSLSVFDKNKGLFEFTAPTRNSSTSELFRGRWGIVDINGNILLEPKYDLIYAVSDGRILVAYSEKEFYQEYVYLDEDFQQVSKMSYDQATVFENGVAAVKDNKGWCIIDKEEEVIERLQGCQNVNDFSEGIAVAEFNRDIRYIDTKGKVLFKVPKGFSGEITGEMSRYREGKIVYESKNKKYGYMDRQGNILVEPIFDEAERIYNGEAYVEIGNKAGVIKFQN